MCIVIRIGQLTGQMLLEALKLRGLKQGGALLFGGSMRQLFGLNSSSKSSSVSSFGSLGSVLGFMGGRDDLMPDEIERGESTRMSGAFFDVFLKRLRFFRQIVLERIEFRPFPTACG